MDDPLSQAHPVKVRSGTASMVPLRLNLCIITDLSLFQTPPKSPQMITRLSLVILACSRKFSKVKRSKRPWVSAEAHRLVLQANLWA
jgi:hypothetical protein